MEQDGSIIRAVEALRDASSVLAFVGAGLSAESGIPTFRGGGGLWEGHAVEQVATPEGFHTDPVLVWRFYSQRQADHNRAKPNPGHFALARMEKLFDQFLLVSQNIDRLCEIAGSVSLVKIHGDLFTLWCTRCAWTGEMEGALDIGDKTPMESLPRCEGCGALARPGIVWFGEYLPSGTLETSLDFASRCDAALIIGTSGLVSGGYGLAETARSNGAAVIEINVEQTPLSQIADVCIRQSSGKALPAIVTRLDNCLK